MSIQQSINQAISGSLYLLGQSTLFKTLKEEREEKISRERNKIDSVMNSTAIPKIAAGNEPLPQTPVEQMEQNESIVPDKKNKVTEESAPESDDPYLKQMSGINLQRLNLQKLLDLKKHLESRVAESARSRVLAKAFRVHISGGGGSLGK